MTPMLSEIFIIVKSADILNNNDTQVHFLGRFYSHFQHIMSTIIMYPIQLQGYQHRSEYLQMIMNTSSDTNAI